MNIEICKEEIEKGRIALWLDPKDIMFIADEWRKMPENISEEDKEIWARLAFRAMTALHKSNIKYQVKRSTSKYIMQH